MKKVNPKDNNCRKKAQKIKTGSHQNLYLPSLCCSNCTLKRFFEPHHLVVSRETQNWNEDCGKRSKHEKVDDRHWRERTKKKVESRSCSSLARSSLNPSKLRLVLSRRRRLRMSNKIWIRVNLGL